MASAIQIPYCGPCGYDDVTKEAKRWCTNCKEGLCEDCEKAHIKNKISRNHKVISINDYRKIENISISEVCEHHGENLEWFCKAHDKALCMVCVTSNHKSCSGVISINIASKNANQSTTLSDLEVSIDGTLCNIKQCITNRNSATKEIEKQELEIKKMVFHMRKKVNMHLDKLEEKLLGELELASGSCKSKYAQILQKLRSAEETLTKLKEKTLHIKQYSSDLQVFLGTYQGHRLVVSETKSIKDAIDASNDYQLKLDLNSLITKLSDEIQNFGHIAVTENTAKIDFRDPKIEQAQKGITVPTSRNISSIQLHLVKTFRIPLKEKNAKMNITGCVMLPNGNLLMANYAQNYLIEYNDKGEHIRDIQVASFPYGIAIIDSYRIAVTYGKGNMLEIRNNITFQVEKNISFVKNVWGVSYENGRLYLVSGYATIQVIDLSGRQLETLQMASNHVFNLTSITDKIFYTDYKSDKEHCCLMNGEELWQFKSESILNPNGISVDDNHNVYVVGFESSNLAIIHHDGKESKILLTESDRLDGPKTVYYDKAKRKLLKCNQKGKVSLYNVV